MRVLAVHPGADHYGADLMLARSLGALQARGHTVTLLVPEDGPLIPVVRALGVEVRVTPMVVLRKALMRPAGLARLALGLGPELLRLRRLLVAERPDLVYVNTVTLPHWTIAAHRLSGRPVACHVRELEDGQPRWLNRVLLAPLLGSQLVVTNSAATGEFVARHWSGLRKRTRLVYNGFEIGPDPVRALVPGRARVALVGRLSPRKGQDLALTALAQVVREGHDVELHLIGTPFRGYEWFEQQLRDQAAELGVGDRVVFRGYVSGVTAELARMDVALVPSRLEPFGNVAVEAQLAGCPVVVARVGGLPEIVDDGRTGLVVPADDASALGSALGRVLADRALAERLGRAGREDAARKFDLRRYSEELAVALEQTAGVDRPSPPRAREEPMSSPAPPGAGSQDPAPGEPAPQGPPAPHAPATIDLRVPDAAQARTA